MNSRIEVESIFSGFEWDLAKFHIAQRAGKVHPIDVFTDSFDAWQNNWNGAFHSNHCWNRSFIFSIIELPTQPDKWLFGGIFRVLSHQKKIRAGKTKSFYKVELHAEGEALIGRLVISWKKDARAKGRIPNTVLPNMAVAEILPETYAGIDFPGYENIDLPFSTLEQLWRDKKPDWYTALANCQGVYLITDTKTGLRYVGSAYGDEGIWSRWEGYFRTGGHGNNVLLKELFGQIEEPTEYARDNMQMCLLEHISSRANEQYVILRESFWKDALCTRGKFGLNAN